MNHNDIMTKFPETDLMGLVEEQKQHSSFNLPQRILKDGIDRIPTVQAPA